MKIICIGRNYVDHAKELSNPVPGKPLVFMKPPTALLVNEKPFYYPDFTKDLHYELEVVLKIGKNGRHVQPEFASGYYQEVSLGIDFTARDVQDELKKKGHPWEIAKGFDHSAVQLADREQLDGVTQLPGIGNIHWCDIADAFLIHSGIVDHGAIGQIDQNHQLVGGVVAFHVKGRVRFCVSKGLGFGEHLTGARD